MSKITISEDLIDCQPIGFGAEGAAVTPVSSTNPLPFAAKPSTSGGLSAARILTGTTGVIKATPGQVYQLSAYNVNASVRYLQLYDKASAPTLSTDTPIATIPLLGASARDVVLTNLGTAFATGIAWAYTTDDIAIPTTAGTSTELHATILYN